MNAKISVLAICVKAIIYLSYNLHDCTFKHILVHFLMQKSLLNIILSIRFVKLKAYFTAKIVTHYLQSIFEAWNRLRRYHL